MARLITRWAISTGIALVAVLVSAGCGENAKSPSNSASSSDAPPLAESLPDTSTASSPPKVTPRFVDAAPSAGIRFTYFNDMVPGRYFMPEVNGGGAAWLDFDQDGWLDLYITNGCRLDAQSADANEHVNRLYRNRGDGTFDDVTAGSGAGLGGFGQGCAAGDFDADGFPDLYLTNYGSNELLRNNGDGTFSEVAAEAQVDDPHWSTSAAWWDADSDGLLDLYVCNYVDVTLQNHQVCQYNGRPGYCGPGRYNAVPDRVFINQGDGTFRDQAEALGMETSSGKGLALAILDFDDDLRAEVYVGNDLTANFLFTRSMIPGEENVSRKLYGDLSFQAGCALSGEGAPEASMGLSCADFDGDGRVDIFITHYFQQKNTLYRNVGKLAFDDDSLRSRVAATSYQYLGFGTFPLDYDLDGHQDVFIANGHVLGPLQPPNEMPPQLLRNDGTGQFADISAFAGPYFHDRWLGRGVAAADYDNDVDTDLAVSHLQRPLALLRNDTDTKHHFLGLVLETPNRIPPVGGRVVVTIGARRIVMPIVAGGSYLSTNDPRLVIGLGDSDAADQVEVFWPSGREDRFTSLSADRYWRVMEGGDPRPLTLE